MVEPMMVAGAAIKIQQETNKLITESNERLSSMQKSLEEASPAFKGMKDIMDRQYKLVMKPLGDMMQLIMKPYIRRMMTLTREGMTKMRQVRKDISAGIISEEDGLGVIGEITKDMSQDFYKISKEMKDVIGPIAYNLAGFEKGMQLVTNTWAAQLTLGVAGFIEAIDKETGILSTGLVNSRLGIINVVNTGATQLFKDIFAKIAAAAGVSAPSVTTVSYDPTRAGIVAPYYDEGSARSSQSYWNMVDRISDHYEQEAKAS